MRSKAILLLLLFLSVSFIFAQNTFNKTIPVGVADEIGYDIIETNDKGFLVAGYNTITANNVWKSCLVNIDSTGNFLAKNDFGTGNDNGIYRFKKTTDGGYIAVGYRYNTALANYQILVLKISAAFSLQWEKELAITPFTWYEEPLFDVIQASDGNYLIAGSDIVSATEQYAFVAGLKASNGDTLWTKKYTQSGYTYTIRAVLQDKDGNFILSGSANNNSTAVNNVLLIKLNYSGSKLWEKLLGGSVNQIGNDLTETDDGYVIAGKKLGSGWEAIIIKTDFDGNQKWIKTFGDGNSAYDDIFAIDKTPDRGYAIAGYVGGAGNNKEAYLVKTDSAGTKLWSKTFGNSTAQDIGYSVKTTTDGGFVISGYSFNNNLWDLYLIKTDARGNSGCNNFPAPECTVPDTVFAGTSVSFFATITSGNGTVNYNWNGTGGLSSTLPAPTFTYNTPGTYYYSLETNDANSCYGICGGKIVVLLNSGIDVNPAQRQPFTISPVPFSDRIDVVFNNPFPGQTAVSLFNIAGEMVFSENGMIPGKENIISLYPDMPAGIYFYKITSGRNEYQGKLIKGI